MRPRLPSGIRHPEELSLLRAPEKEKKKKKEKEPEEEVYDLTKVVLVGGERRLGQPKDAAGEGGTWERPGWVGEAYWAWLTPTRTPGVAPASFRGMPAHFSDSAQTEACYHMLSRPQPPPDPLLLQRLPRPSSLLDKTQLHSRCAAPQVCTCPGAPRHVSCSQSPPPPLWPARSRPQAPCPSFRNQTILWL